MGEGSRVPLSGDLPDTADRPADTARAVPSAPGESSLPEAATATVNATSDHDRSARPSSPLPRRVRGTNGARPPARLERPELPESFLDRFRAAAAASEAREAAEEREALREPKTIEDHSQKLDQSAQGKPSEGSSSLPLRVRDTNGAPTPPQQLGSPFPLKAAGECADAPGAITQPIPAVPDSPVTESLGGRAASTATTSADQQTADRPQDAPAEEPAAESPAAAATETPVPLVSQVRTKPTTSPPANRRPAAPPGVRAQPGISYEASGKAPESTAGKKRTGRAYRMIGLLVIVVVLGVGAGSFVALHHNAHSGHTALLPSAKIPLAIRNGAGAWVASQVAASDVVACDPVMCQVLQAHGLAPARLRVQWPGSNNLSGCAVIVATPILRGQFGARLGSVYAPGIIARFGSGDQEITIRAAAPHGAAAYRSDLARDLAARRAAGAEFASGPASSQLSATDKRQLAAGQVDSRLIVVIAGLEAEHPVRVVAFGDASPGVTATTAPFRSADLAITSNASKLSLLAALGQEVTRFRQYRPARVHTLRLPTGQLALRIEFPAPSPLGLFGY